MKLTEKQKRFADYYIETGNGAESYKRAYPNCKKDDTARVNASKLLTNTNIKEYIDKQLKEMKNDRIADATEVLEYLTDILRGNVKEECVVVVNEGDFVSSAKVIEKQVTPKDRNKAAELLAKRYGLLTENLNLNADMTVNIIDNVPKEVDEE